LQCVAVCCGLLQCVAVCCSVLQCVVKTAAWLPVCIFRSIIAVCCSVLQQRVAVCCKDYGLASCVFFSIYHCSVLQCVAAYCSVLQRVAVCCSVLQCVAKTAAWLPVCIFHV